MHWLVDSVPIWVLGPFLVIVCAAAAWGGRIVVHRRFPDLAGGGHNTIAANLLMITSGLYGLLAAFLIVTLYTDFTEARGVVHDEANHLAQIHRATGALDPAAHDAIRSGVERYVGLVRDQEWALMADGRMSDEAWAAIDDLYADVQGYEPAGETESAFYSEVIDHLAGVVEARRDRTASVTETLPGPLLFLVFCGAVLLIANTFFFGTEGGRGESLIFALMGAYVGFTLFVVIVFDLPFAGDLAVTPDAFTQGVLAEIP